MKFYSGFFKRCFDVIFALLGVLFFALILIPVYFMIKLDDRGPVFYLSTRIGKHGKPFKMMKFRSMSVNAPDLRMEDGSTYNAKDDPRLTRVGRFLRESSLDEIPQILNVLQGSMSFIGPRPDIHIHEKQVDEVMYNLRVRPGITGYSQAFYRSESTWLEKIRNDRYYVDHLSLGLDMKIIVRTFLLVVKREKTYRATK